MKISRSISLILVLIAVTILPAFGQMSSAKMLRLDIKATKKRTDIERTQTTDKNMAAEKWLYNIEIHNATFADQSDLTVEYRCYKRDDKHGMAISSSKIPLKAFSGSEKIPTLAKTADFKFSTQEISIEKMELKAGWEYNDGSKDKVKDSLYGIWIKIKKNGEIVSEFLNPPSLKSKVEW